MTMKKIVREGFKAYDLDVGDTVDCDYLISQIDPGFKNTSLENPKTHQLYTVDLILQSVERYNIRKAVLNMLIYDALIANRDRNPSNYGIIKNHETGKVRFSPLYDNGASLGVSMVDHRLADCFNCHGEIVDGEHLKVVVHKHIVGKVTLDRFLQYQDKQAWDSIEEKRILTKIEEKRSELLPKLENGEITRDEYHRQLNRVGNEYRKFDVSTLQYQTLISYLTLNYVDEIEEIISNIERNITKENIDKIFDYYKEDLPIDRLNMAKAIVLERAKWITSFYSKNRSESRGKVL